MKRFFSLTLLILVMGLNTHYLLSPLPYSPQEDSYIYMPQINKPITGLSLDVVGSGFYTPVVIATTPLSNDSRLFIAEQVGIIRILSGGQRLDPPFLDISGLVDSESESGEQGLLGFTFHPNYAQNRYFFVSYIDKNTGPNAAGYSTIARYETDPANPNQALPESGQIVWRTPQPQDSHNGGDIHFGPDGYLYFSLGDGTSSDNPDPNNNAQNRAKMLGKIGRIDVNRNSAIPPDCDGGADTNLYTIPADNPFISVSGSCDEIWALGFRNPWRFSFDKLTGNMFIADVGMWHWEEINIYPANAPGGRNYGWRCYEGNFVIFPESCNQATNYTFPDIVLAHPVNDDGDSLCRSITGGYVYRGSQHLGLYGDYIFGDFCRNEFFILHGSANNTWTLASLPTNVTNIWPSTFGQDQNGELYVADYVTGLIYQLNPR
ncbi:MAG TPA: PQQ-dependent sugar dehydrogenase [Anaerolineae bacterium]|nr:PQQ-dependent sugar dehydrogenase [Anaerolineae bacterium]